MSQNRFNKFRTPVSRHRQELHKRSKTWGQTKFKPKPFVRAAPAPEPEHAKPWQHVKNDILDDEEELRSADRFNMNSQEAKEIIKKREQSHRRNIIEAKRNEETTWESFDDGNNATGSSNSTVNKDNDQPKPYYRVTTKNPELLSTRERNFVRQKLTRIATRKHRDADLDMMINDMKRSKYVKPQNFKKFTDEKKH